MSVDGHAGERTRIVLRPIGSPLPLGFFAFAVGMLLLGAQAVGWLPLREQPTLGIVLVTFVFPLEALATVVAYAARDTVGATTLGVFATSWLMFGVIDATSPPGRLSHTLAFYLFAFAAVVVALATISALGKPIFTVLLAMSAARAILSGVHEQFSSASADTAAGWVAIVLAGLAVYGGLALSLEDLHQREVLPLFRTGAARATMAGGLEEQLGPVEREAGVRHQL